MTDLDLAREQLFKSAGELQQLFSKVEEKFRERRYIVRASVLVCNVEDRHYRLTFAKRKDYGLILETWTGHGGKKPHGSKLEECPLSDAPLYLRTQAARQLPALKDALEQALLGEVPLAEDAVAKTAAWLKTLDNVIQASDDEGAHENDAQQEEDPE